MRKVDWNSGFGPTSSGEPWDFEPNSPVDNDRVDGFYDQNRNTISPNISRQNDGRPDPAEGCFGAFMGLIALPVATLLGAVFMVLN